MMHKVVLISGGSSGIGLCTARALRGFGCRVYEMSRHGRGEDGIFHITGDVSDEASAQGAVDEVLSREGKIDIIICNAGFGISGAVEFTRPEDAKKLLDVNLFGAVNLCRAVIPAMRKAGQGRIVCISSVAGAIPIPFQTYYSVSKSAVNAFCLALANEVKPFGISVCAVLPGDIQTGFTAARLKDESGDDIYSGRIARSVSGMERDETNGMSPDKAGLFIARTALKKHVRPMYSIGIKYKFFVFLSKILPCGAVRFIVGKMYAE